MDRALQQEWKAHGEDKFRYEVLETIDDEMHPMGVADALKNMRADWAARLHAKVVL
jgi:hypothetical protein